jgi:hypothetical protein
VVGGYEGRGGGGGEGSAREPKYLREQGGREITSKYADINSSSFRIYPFGYSI